VGLSWQRQRGGERGCVGDESLVPRRGGGGSAGARERGFGLETAQPRGFPFYFFYFLFLFLLSHFLLNK
jgi:hypothetical protein